MPFLLGESFSFPEALRRVLQCCLQGLSHSRSHCWDGKVPGSEADLHSYSTGKKKSHCSQKPKNLLTAYMSFSSRFCLWRGHSCLPLPWIPILPSQTQFLSSLCSSPVPVSPPNRPAATFPL